MPGQTVLHLWCACKRVGTVPYRDDWDLLLRDQVLRKFRCRACGKRPVDLRKAWASGIEDAR